MELDTGAARTVISKCTFDSIWPANIQPKLYKSHVLLKAYGGTVLNVVEEVTAKGRLVNRNESKSTNIVVY